MATRSEKLNRLVVKSPCPKAWDEMTGGDARRHCAQCDRQVFNFQSMTPRQIAARLEASGGHLCGRITRDADGHLLTFEPPYEPMAPPSFTAQRASPVVAALVTAFLGLGSAGAKPAPADPAAVESTAGAAGDRSAARPAQDPDQAPGGGASLRGNVHDEQGSPRAGFQILALNTLDGGKRSAITAEDGDYSIDDLDAGIYFLEVSGEGFGPASVPDVVLQAGETRQANLTVSPKVDEESETTGIIAFAPEPLRQVFGESTLAALATVGATRPAGDASGEVVTELRIDLLFKGHAPGRSVRVLRYKPEGRDATFVPGTKVLALLSPRDEDSGPKASSEYESADYAYGVKALSDAEIPIYRERIGQLARLLDGSTHPEDLVEWLVATAEEPLLRGEATGEISDALWTLDQLAESRKSTVEQTAAELRAIAASFLSSGKSFEGDPSFEMTAAFLSAGHRERLARALLATHTATEADLTLYGIVERDDPQAARSWLVRTVRELKAGPKDPSSREALSRLAEILREEADTKP